MDQRAQKGGRIRRIDSREIATLNAISSSLMYDESPEQDLDHPLHRYPMPLLIPLFNDFHSVGVGADVVLLMISGLGIPLKKRTSTYRQNRLSDSGVVTI